MGSGSVQHFGMEVPVENNCQEVKELVGRIRPDWLSDGKQLVMRQFAGGVTNLLLGCHPEGGNPDEMLLVRLYGENSDLVIDRKCELRNIRMLCSHGLAEPVYGTFANGMVYGFAPGRPLSRDDLTIDHFAVKITGHFARLHRLTPDPDRNVEPDVVNNLKAWLKRLPEMFTDLQTHQRYLSLFPRRQVLQKEVDEMCELLPTLRSPIVYCHNDTTAGNIIYEETSDSLTFVDHEYGGFNYRGFDLGNHFCEFCGVDGMDFSLFPDRTVQLSWLRHYVTAYNRLAGVTEHVSDDALHQLYIEANIFALASNLQWTLWALLQAEHSLIGFDYLTYGKTRYDEYRRRKQSTLALLPQVMLSF